MKTSNGYEYEKPDHDGEIRIDIDCPCCDGCTMLYFSEADLLEMLRVIEENKNLSYPGGASDE